MTILSDVAIKHELYAGGLKIEGLDWANIGPSSVDLYLGDSLVINPDATDAPTKFVMASLRSLEFALGTTVETVTLPDNIMAQVHGCSSIGRTGLFVQNAGLIDPGFSGQITLELFNASGSAMALRAGQRICQLSFAYLDQQCAVPYGQRGRYQNQRGATAARPPREG